ncbi:methyltransferase domain-containing protein [Entomomonas sp. E2T0]|uniref:putative RNA methyltransferase n=1 Tax=Entomomonas sp. E2T0 TaxID=2930213 RepID=UPI00222811C6|nr:methyltransferase domain-containing protein [Entomomonas sp. E2T0]UYZ83321.1 methyltransferase domain-containing protein [Entomomonas sp. E2T0]
MLICPLCNEALVVADKVVNCSNNHSFDRAKQGYLNLLPVQHKNSRAPGDNLEMVIARRDFLAAGHYAPLALRFAELASQQHPNNWLDVGCGEGFYTHQLAMASPNTVGYALDISRDAIKQACKFNKNIQWLVASMARIPLANQSCNLIATIFSPFNWQEALRVVSQQGGILRLGPTNQHLIELREKLYDEVRPYQDDKHLQQVPNELQLVFTDYLTFSLTLNNEQDRKNLLAMTPHGWRASAEKRKQVIEHPLKVTVAVRYDYFKLI